MSSGQCERFLQNAWKKELCSNCFKSKEEHPKKQAFIIPQINGKLPDPPQQGILRKPENAKRNALHRVVFPCDEPQIIGYGGDIDVSDDEDFDDLVADVEEGRKEDLDVENENDIALRKLTNKNTHFNSNPSNLESTQPATPVTNNNNSNSNNKPIVVSITPFTPAPKVADSIKRSQPIDKNSKFRPNKQTPEEDNVRNNQETRVQTENKINGKLTASTKVANLFDKAKKKVNQLPVIGDPLQAKVKTTGFSSNNENSPNVILDVFPLAKEPPGREKLTPTIILETKKSEQIPVPDDPSSKPTTELVEEKRINDLRKSEEVFFEMGTKLSDVEKMIGGEEIIVFEAPSSTPDKDSCSKELPITETHSDLCATDKQSPEISVPEVQPVSCVDSEQLSSAGAASPATELEALCVKSDLDQSTPVHVTLPDTKLDIAVLPIEQEICIKTNPVNPIDMEPVPSPPETPQRCRPPPSLKSPPPTSNPQPISSYLHDISSVAKPKIGNKPKIPAKPASILSVAAKFQTRPPLLPERSKESVPDESISGSCGDQNKKRPAPKPPSPALRSSRSSEDLLTVTPITRRALSLSQENLTDPPLTDDKKKSSRGKFSLRKLLNLGKHKESGRREYRFEHLISPANQSGLDPKCKLEIIHPLDLTASRRSSSSTSSASSETKDDGTSQVLPESRGDCLSPLPKNANYENGDKPLRPPPPKNCHSPSDIYAKIGDVRSRVAPCKPIRTGSLREVKPKSPAIVNCREEEGNKHLWTGSLRGVPSKLPMPLPEDSGYESFNTTASSQSSLLTTPEENVYEAVLVGRPSTGRPFGKCSATDSAKDYVKFRFLKSLSGSYCNSETESEIYSPYSFHGSEMGEDEGDYSTGQFQKASRLKVKKGRSIVHKSLEDNYGAVVVANHEALSQVVDQMQQNPVVPPYLRGLCSTMNLRWSDLNVVTEAGRVSVDRRVFYQAFWNSHPITLCVMPHQTCAVARSIAKLPCSLRPLSEFHDLVPACYLADGPVDGQSAVQCLISLWSRVKVESVSDYSATVCSTSRDDSIKEIVFILLQVINAVKALQAAGTEEMARDLPNAVLIRDDKDPYPRVCFLPDGAPVNDPASLCACLLHLLNKLPAIYLTPLLRDKLLAEKASSLSQAKAILEFSLWGPGDIDLNSTGRESALQRWLDLERASVLHGLVRTPIPQLNIFEQYHLLFLVNTSAKVLSDASLVLEGCNQPSEVQYS